VRWLYRKIIDILIGSSVERSSDDNLTGLSEEDSSTNKPIEDIAGVGGKKADELRAAGYESVTDIQAASRTDLSRVNGIGNALAARIKKDAEDIKVETNPED
jgi:large subunit ribosomal protein L32e